MEPSTRILIVFIALLGVLAVTCPSRIHAEDNSPVTLTLTPRFGFAPLTVRLSIRVPKDPDNTQLCVIVSDSYGASYYRASCWWHGADGPLQTVEDKIARNLPSTAPFDQDNYVATAIITRKAPDGKTSTFLDSKAFRVMESVN